MLRHTASLRASSIMRLGWTALAQLQCIVGQTCLPHAQSMLRSQRVQCTGPLAVLGDWPKRLDSAEQLI